MEAIMKVRAVVLSISLFLMSGIGFGAEEKAKEPQTQSEAKQQSPEEIGKWEGFRGIKWGTDRKDIEGLGGKIKFGNFDGYSKKDESLKIGEARLAMLVYGFHKDKLAMVAIMSEGHENYLLLKETFKARFGDPVEENSITETTLWAEDVSGETGTAISMEYKDYEKRTEITIMSIDQFRIMKKDLEEKGKAGAADL
jgi:hypothetical protein